ncbi:hypothetical protein SEA_AMOCHICK_72 [Mycobacterium phage Amochick]|uniref:Uncharacterized protein n=1 Tax=Mycobacterium phage Amochick TaxID=2301540 RepID=A0A385D134_9CAUD|nr:hypothetical protein SEA_AMOCHICK_72 [Mycobacterium phage Amochick]
MTDMWDEPVDLDAVADWDAEAPQTGPACPETNERASGEGLDAGGPYGDTEAAYWRSVRDPDTPAYTDPDTAPYAVWLENERRVAMQVSCPVCKVVVEQPCIRVRGNPPTPVHPPEPIRKYPAHNDRLRAARRKQTPQ